MRLSTLRPFVGVMGGELETMARFPEQRHVRLRGTGELNESGRTVEMS